MRTLIVVPPSLRLPGVRAADVAVLAGALRATGNDVRVVDLDRRAADLLLTRERLDGVLALGRATVADRERRGERRSARDLEKTLEKIAPALAAAPEAKAILRDRSRALDATAFRAAIDALDAATRFLFQLDPIFTPSTPGFAAAVRAHVDADAWSPLRDLHAAGLLDAPPDFDAERAVFVIAHDAEIGEAFRIARRWSRARPGLRVVAAGPLVDGRRSAFAELGFETLGSEVLGSTARADFIALDDEAPFAPAQIHTFSATRLDDVRALFDAGARFAALDGGPHSAEMLATVAREFAGERIAWVASARCDRSLADPDLCRDLRAAGCRSLVLDLASPTEAPVVLAALRAAGISAEIEWTIGHAGESHADVRATLEFLAAHRAEFGLASFAPPSDRSSSRLTPDELALVERAVSPTSDAAIVERALHLPWLVERGVDLAPIARPFAISSDVLAYLGASDARANATRPSGFRSEDFGFRARLEAAFPAIRDEWAALAKERLVPWPQDEAYDGAWTLFALWMSGKRFDENCARCPQTTRAVEAIPGMVAAGFSILGARTTLPIHCGLRKDVLRAHLAIDIPEDSALLIHGEAREWTPGKTFVFDDTLPHAAWNRSERDKVILVVDFLRNATDRERVEGAAMDGEFFGELFPEWKDRAR